MGLIWKGTHFEWHDGTTIPEADSEDIRKKASGETPGNAYAELIWAQWGNWTFG